MAKQAKNASIEITKMQTGTLEAYIVGTEPLICNRMSQKVMQELLFPKGRKGSAERATTIKHNPMREFRDSPYTSFNPKAETFLELLPSMFKRAMAGAAVDIEGIAKAQVNRLIWVRGERVAVYGIPKLMMSVTRSADMNKTPDVRTRAIIPEWACKIVVGFAHPQVNKTSVANLLASAGITQGIGDWRPEKGSGTYGQYELVAKSDATFKRIVKSGGRKAQEAAMKNPSCHDDETESLLAWFNDEIVKRGKEGLLKVVS